MSIAQRILKLAKIFLKNTFSLALLLDFQLVIKQIHYLQDHGLCQSLNYIKKKYNL